MTYRLPRVRLATILLAAGFTASLATWAATATLEPASGSKVKGQVTFIQDGPRVRATGEITGLTPGRHGFHVHEKGDCNAADAESAGTEGRKHGGDVGNITASASGTATVNTTLSGVSIASLMGKGLVVEKSDASGSSGARVACGVVK